ncbi:MAG: DUF2142 domain-containing protein [Oscillospiraceae bacterium]
MKDKKKLYTALFVIVAIVIAAALSELAFVGVSNRGGECERSAISGEKFSSWEFEKRESGYYALANNSYFYIENVGGIKAKTIEVSLSRGEDDSTETIMFFRGACDGIEGEFLVPLSKTGDGIYTAAADFERIDAIKIYPTELVRTVVEFDGIVINPTVIKEGFSFGRAVMFAMLALCAVEIFIVILYQKKQRARLRSMVWFAVWSFICAAAMLCVFFAGRIYTALRSYEGILLPAVFFAVTVLVCAVYVIAVRLKSTASKAAAAVLCIGTVFALASAPLQAPDEPLHFLRAYTVSCGKLDFDGDFKFPNDISLLEQYFPAEYYNNVHEKGGSVPDSLSKYYAALESGQTPKTESKTSAQLLLVYVPSAVGIRLARVFGGDALVCLYAARLMNVAVLAVCAYFALRLASRYRCMLLLLIFAPLCLFMSASASYDAMFFALTVLYFGFIFKKEMTAQDLVLAVLCFGGLVSIKPTYLPLALLIFIVPKESFKPKIKRWGALLALVTAALILWGGTLGYAALMRSGIDPQVPLAGVNVAAQVQYVLANPIRYAIVAMVDGYMNSFYLTTGGLFGWLDANAVFTSFIVPITVFFVSAMSARACSREKKTDWLVFGSCALLIYAVIVTGFYCTWSTLGSTSILGVQARYFVPIIPCAAAVLGKALSHVLAGALNEDKMESTVFWVLAGTAFVSAAELFCLYFLM